MTRVRYYRGVKIKRQDSCFVNEINISTFVLHQKDIGSIVFL